MRLLRSLPAIACCALALTACVPKVQSPVRVLDASGEIRIAEDALVKAIRTSDSASLDRLLAPEFTIVSQGSAGSYVSRSRWLRTVTDGELRTDSISYRDLSVVTPAADSAVATLWLSWTAARDRGPTTDVRKLDDTWVRRSGTWVVVQRHMVARGQ